MTISPLLRWTRGWSLWCISAGVASVAHAQVPLSRSDSGPTAAIVGTVFDSISLRPLGGAHVHLADLARDVVADARGAFRFDSVSARVHSLWADHPTLDQLGLYSITASVETGPLAPAVTVALTVPSFATLWQRACPNQATCTANVWIDGMTVPTPGGKIDELSVMNKDGIALIEIYNSGARAPLQYGGGNSCGWCWCGQKCTSTLHGEHAHAHVAPLTNDGKPATTIQALQTTDRRRPTNHSRGD